MSHVQQSEVGYRIRKPGDLALGFYWHCAVLKGLERTMREGAASRKLIRKAKSSRAVRNPKGVILGYMSRIRGA